MEFQDKVLKCIDCSTDFIFTAGEQLFFHDKQFKNEPRRCKNCKSKRALIVWPGGFRAKPELACGNTDQLLAVWQGHNRAVQTDSGSPCFLPGMFPATPANGYGLSWLKAGCAESVASPSPPAFPIPTEYSSGDVCP